MTAQDSPAPPPRRAYHHGNLASALADTALALARVGGPEAVVLREAARRVGVSPSAAYRHFPDRTDLLRSAQRLAREEMAGAIQRAARISADSAADGRAPDPFARLRALGVSYVRFALAEPGLFRTAFCQLGPHGIVDCANTGDDATADDLALGEQVRPFGLLCAAVDELVVRGDLTAYRAAARIAVWLAVHGLAALLLDGPLNPPPGEPLDRTIRDLVEVVVRGLATGTDAQRPSGPGAAPPGPDMVHGLRALPQHH